MRFFGIRTKAWQDKSLSLECYLSEARKERERLGKSCSLELSAADESEDNSKLEVREGVSGLPFLEFRPKLGRINPFEFGNPMH